MLSDNTAENSVISGIINYGQDTFLDVDDIIDCNTFTNEINQILYKCCESHFFDNETIDIPTLLSYAHNLGFGDIFNRPETINYVRTLSDYKPNQSNVKVLASKIRKLQIARLIKENLKHCDTQLERVTGQESAHDILSIVETPVFDLSTLLREGETAEAVKIGDGIQDYIQKIKDEPCTHIGLSTGLSLFDRYIGGGLRPGSVSIVGARPKVGKSFLSLFVGLENAKQNVKVLYLDTEMTKEEQWPRLLSRLARVENTLVETGKFDEVQYKRIVEAGKKIDELPFYHVSVAGKGFEEISSVMRRWMKKNVKVGETPLIILDYLKTMSSSDVKDSMQEFQVLGFNLITLQNFAVKHKVPILTFVQLNRDGIQKESTDVASGSDRIIWFCSNFSILKKKTPEEIQEDGSELGNRKLIPLIARHGEEMDEGNYINVVFEGKYGNFIECGTRYNSISTQRKFDGFHIKDDDQESVPF